MLMMARGFEIRYIKFYINEVVYYDFKWRLVEPATYFDIRYSGYFVISEFDISEFYCIQKVIPSALTIAQQSYLIEFGENRLFVT